MPLHDLTAVRQALEASGFDLCVTGGTITPAGPRALLLVANSRTIWPRFIDAIRRDSDIATAADPLDTWVERVVGDIVRDHPGYCSIQWAHDQGANRFSALDAAEALGLAVRGPAHLAVHPRVGPWFAVRALATFDVDWSAGPEPARPCDGCDAPCVSAFERARRGRDMIDADEVAADWRDWVAVRDACPVGQIHRYSNDQIRYHYTRDRAVLVHDSDQGTTSA